MTTSTGADRDPREVTEQSPKRGRVPADTFANRLMLSRALAGHLSIREAADLCGIGRGAWTNWERGARPLNLLDVVPLIAEGLDVDEQWLLFGGPLTSARGRPVGRSDTLQYHPGPPERPSNRRPSGRVEPAMTGPGHRRPARVVPPTAEVTGLAVQKISAVLPRHHDPSLFQSIPTAV